MHHLLASTIEHCCRHRSYAPMPTAWRAKSRVSSLSLQHCVRSCQTHSTQLPMAAVTHSGWGAAALCQHPCMRCRGLQMLSGEGMRPFKGWTVRRGRHCGLKGSCSWTSSGWRWVVLAHPHDWDTSLCNQLGPVCLRLSHHHAYVQLSFPALHSSNDYGHTSLLHALKLMHGCCQANSPSQL